MFLDAREFESGKAVSADICIIGGGAAGITIAREFIGTPVKICLLESGGFNFDIETQNLYSGSLAGYSQPPLNASRLRFLGGTTNHWNGNIWPMFKDDFEQRSWIPDSGWPITFEQLEPYYKKAAEVVQLLGPYTWSADELTKYLQPMFLEKGMRESRDLQRVISQHSPPTRFGNAYRSELEQAKNVEVLLHSNVTSIDTDADSQHVTGLSVKCLTGNAFTVNAKQYVLATGGIENARVLLASNKVAPKGVGNQNDVVGRYFGDHLIASDVGRFVTACGTEAIDVPQEHKEKGIKAYLSLSPELLQEKQLARSIISYDPIRLRWKDIGGLLDEWDSEYGFFSNIIDVVSAYVDKDEIDLGRFHHVVEQIPCADSRVTLTEERDALGVPKTKLDWRFVPEQKETIEKSLRLFAEKFAATEVGRMQLLESANFGSFDEFLYSTSYHHLGTTRMHSDPKKGVVDANCKVHGVSNLFIAGSSVFTTAGVSNPTLTIVALAVRLADKLKNKSQIS